MEWAPRDSAINLATNPEYARWSPEVEVLANVFDAVQVGNWQRAGRRSAPRPKPYPRPGDKTTKTFGSAHMSETEAKAFLAARRQGKAVFAH